MGTDLIERILYQFEYFTIAYRERAKVLKALGETKAASECDQFSADLTTLDEIVRDIAGMPKRRKPRRKKAA
jgi:hypothetical protein